MTVKGKRQTGVAEAREREASFRDKPGGLKRSPNKEPRTRACAKNKLPSQSPPQNGSARRHSINALVLLIRSVPRNGKLDNKPASISAVMTGNPSLMKFHNTFANRQPQPRAAPRL